MNESSARTSDAAVNGTNATMPGRRLPLRAPALVWVAAVAAGLIHMAPYWRAAVVTQPGYTFTWNLSVNPDFMQYRVWLRQTQDEGVVVSNRFTLESNNRHLPVLLYYAVGRTAKLLDARAEVVYAYAGALFAMVLVWLVWLAVCAFLPPGRLAKWTFAAILAGGGLSGYFTMVQEYERLHSLPLVSSLILEHLRNGVLLGPFEGYRDGYVISAILDTHNGLYWSLVTGAMLVLYRCAQGGRAVWIAGAAAFFALTTLIHVHQAVPLLAMSGGAVGLCTVRGLPVRRGVGILLAVWAATIAALLTIAWLVRMSGLEAPIRPRMPAYFVTLLIAFPLTAAVAA